MSATEVLRRMLDERGVEWDGCILMGALITFWGEQERDGRWPYRYWEHDGWASFSADPKSELFTPEQAIEATLGAGTCHECAGMDDVFECSACGGRYEGWALKRWARYCPDCGRRIEVGE